jgi:hypothetical protein
VRKKRKVTAVLLGACSACILCIVFCFFMLSGALVHEGGHTTSLVDGLLQVDFPLLATPTATPV